MRAAEVLVLTYPDTPAPAFPDDSPPQREPAPVEHEAALRICRATVAWLRASVRNGRVDRETKRAAEDRRRGGGR